MFIIHKEKKSQGQFDKVKPLLRGLGRGLPLLASPYPLGPPVWSFCYLFFISLLKWLTSEEPVFMQVHYSLYIQYYVLYLEQIDYINICETIVES